MNRVIILFSIITFSIFTVQSQNALQVPCSTEEYKQFDFWLGTWEVFDAKNTLIGTNNIVKMTNACAMQENWESIPGPSMGTSYNYYNGLDKSWNQLWIDNSGGSLLLKGSYALNKMVLKSDLIKNEKGVYYNQITWFKNTDGTVTQLWEVLDENHTVFNELFRGTYKKIIK